jgi:ubiquinone/menaquinone biosynthesis C-methylase UbiE
MTISNKGEGFVADVNRTETLTWLINFDSFVNRGMGGALSDELSERLSHVYRERQTPPHILDIACGPGGWVRDIVREHPEYEVTGVDISRPMIDYARDLARTSGFTNAHFRVMDITEPMNFPEGSFDLINARTLFGVLSHDMWPRLLRECLRILRPGGMIRLTELEAPISTSPALNWLWNATAQAFFARKRSFSPDGTQIGIIAVLKRLLREAGYQDVHHQAYAFDLADPQQREAFRQNFMIVFELVKPFMLGSGVVTDKEYELHYQQMLAEMLDESFEGIWIYLSAIGTKQ